jgi:thiazole synthase
MTQTQIDEETLTLGPYTLRSRLIVGTGKYTSADVMVQALEASGTQMVTVAIRRVNLTAGSTDPVMGHLDRQRYHLLPNTAGCYTAQEAIRVARLAREAGLATSEEQGAPLIKLEVLGDPKTLLPDTHALLEATEVLVKEGFIVMPYTNDDPIVAKRLVEAGAVCVMPLAAPIGSGQGILNRLNIQFIREAVKVPVILDAGVGTASDATVAMELGADGVLMKTAIAAAKDPVKMAQAMRLGIEAGRLSYQAGRIPKRPYATASSPETGKVGN